MELTELCKELNNWFDVERHFGTFTIEGNELTNDIGLQENQYYRIVGSIFNDGVYKYGDSSVTLTNEEFDGAVWAMAIPPEVIALLGDITNWENEYSSAILSPYQSESFGGYSYTKGSSNSSNSGQNWLSFKSVFSDKLNRWRKV